MSEVIQFPRPSERRSAEGARCLTSAGRPEREVSANPINADTPIIRAIDQLFANQGQRIAGLMGEK